MENNYEGIEKSQLDEYEKVINSKDFKLVEHIYETYNESIDYYKVYREAAEAYNAKEAANALSIASMKLAAVVEWTAKNLVYSYYNNLISVKGVSDPNYEEWNRICRFKKLNINNHSFELNMNTHNLFDKIKVAYRTDINRAGISFFKLDNESIRESLINGYKHIGTIPNAESYLQTLNEAYKLIKGLLNGDMKNTLKSITQDFTDSWEELFFSCEYFKGNYKHYILLTDEIKSIEVVKSVFRIKWDLILDFSYKSDNSESLYDQYMEQFNQNQANLKYLCDIKENEILIATPNTYWLRINGNVEKSDGNGILTDNDLVTEYVKNTKRLIKAFSGEYTSPTELIVLGCSNFKKSVIRILQNFDEEYKPNDLKIHIMNSDNNFLANLIEMDSLFSSRERFKIYDLNLEQLGKAISYNIGISDEKELPTIQIPHTSQGKGFIDIEEYQSMKSVFELVYFDIDKELDKSTNYDRLGNYYRGFCKIDWDLIKDDNTVSQVQEMDIKSQILRLIENNMRSIFVIDYEPGTGGTTFIRKMAYLMHRDYPTVIISRYVENTLVSYLLEIYKQSYKGIAIFIDSNDLGLNDVQKLQRELVQESEFSFEIIYVVRKEVLRQTTNVKNAKRHLLRLDYDQCLFMQRKLDPYIESELCQNKLHKCIENAKNNPKSEEHIPFVLSMFAFDEKFIGVKDYIKHSFENLSDIEKDILFVLALADYVNYKVDAKYFHSLYGENTVRLMCRDDYILFPLIKSSKDVSSKKRFFHIRYFLFTKEILCYFSGSNEITFNNLLEQILAMIKNSRPSEYFTENNEIVKLLHKLFIEREDKNEDDYDIKGTYSQLVSKLINENKKNTINKYDNSKDAVVKVFKQLVLSYPDQPHFAAHLARYYFYTTNNFPGGFEEISKAINVGSGIGGYKMGTLYHIKAMGYTAIIQNIFFKEIREHKKNYKRNRMEEDILNIESNLKLVEDNIQNAEANFKLAKLEYNSRFVSNIAECNMKLGIANLYDEIKQFTLSTNCKQLISDEMIINLYDSIESLIEDCELLISGEKGEINARNSKQLISVRESLVLEKANSDEIKDICKQLIKNGSEEVKVIAKRKLSRIYYNEVFDVSNSEVKNEELYEIVSMMEENFDSEIVDSTCFRIWFKALRLLEVVDVESELEDTLLKLEKWTSIPNAPADAYYYKYIVKFILACEQQTLTYNSIIRDDLDKMLYDLKRASEKMPRKTIAFEWLSEEGQGLKRLITSNDLAKFEKDAAVKTLSKFIGQLPNKDSLRTRAAFISHKGLPVCFNPQSINDRITESSENKYVSFGVGFSYDGLRAYHDSIAIYKGDFDKESQLEIRSGIKVTVEVAGYNSTFVNCNIVGKTGIRVDISYYDIITLGYSKENKPPLETVLRVKLIEERTLKGGIKVWTGTVNIANEENINTPFADLLKDYKG